MFLSKTFKKRVFLKRFKIHINENIKMKSCLGNNCKINKKLSAYNTNILAFLGILVLASSIILTACTKRAADEAPAQSNNNIIIYKENINSSDSKTNVKSPEDSSSFAQTDNNIKNQAQAPKEVRSIPVLMYHSVEYEKDNPVRISPKNFKEQMKYLYDNHYTTLTLDELYRYFQNGIEIPEKSVVITFDDGYEDNYTNAYPILKEYGFKAVIFEITNTIDKDLAYLTSSQLIEMEQNGIDIESHTVSHIKLGELSYDKQLNELKSSKEILEKILNKKVNYIAYPFGSYNENTLKAVKEAGYTMAFTTNGRWSGKDDGIYTLDRVYISGFFNIEIFIERINNPKYKISWYNIWRRLRY